ncbi:hypothetical protein Btru_000324 [Bulinus truncatus]|nr:hypothetical protein Btru_000324 [Bulinus truncatus]
MHKADRRVHFADQCFYCLRPHDSNKLHHFLKQQQRKLPVLFQGSPVSSPLSQTSVYASDTCNTEDNGDLNSSAISVDSTERHVWAERAEISRNYGDKANIDANDIRIQDLTSAECETRSSVSLLDSDSVYLPFDVPSSPIESRRPFTAPGTFSEQLKNESVHHDINKSPRSRPRTAIDSRFPAFTKFDNLDHLHVRPLNQHAMKGYVKPSFDMARPPTSSSEPSVSTHKDSMLPTARSQDYESSGEQTVSESEPQNLKPASSGQSPQPVAPFGDHVKPVNALQDKLNHIKIVAGSKKAIYNNGKNLKDRTSLCFNKNTFNKIKSTYSHPSHEQSPDITLPISGSSSRSDRDTKQIKGKLNMERMEKGKTALKTASNFFNSVMAQDPQLGHKAATFIQAFWRGYWAREHNSKVISIRKEIRARRAEDHIILLRKDLERNRQLYEKEKRMRVLQMEAIRLLYNEVQTLKSHSVLSNKDLHSSPTNYSPLTTAMPSSVLMGNNEINRTHDLERTCLSLQNQVSQLQETLASVSSAVFKTNSLETQSFDLTDNSDSIQITSFKDDVSVHSRQSSDETKYWSLIPNSLSPYPSEEEESYFQLISVAGAPTPPRCLRIQHHSPSALVLSWKPSSSGGNAVEHEGNKHIIGYRVYVNETLKAFVTQSTSVLVEGLNSSKTYKFYVKALSGFGESLESNILMCKLARSSEKLNYTTNSESSIDTDVEEPDKRRQRQRRHRKSPRPDMKKSSAKSIPRLSNQDSTLDKSDKICSQNINMNSNLMATSPPDILTHPKLHKHRRHKSPVSDKQGDKRWTLSPSSRDMSRQKSCVSSYTTEEKSVNSDIGESLSSPSLRHSPDKRGSPPSGSSKQGSVHQPIRKDHEGIKVSPASGSDVAAVDESSSKLHSSSMSETFTIDKSRSLIESISAIAEQNLAGLTFGSPTSGHKGHSRVKSRDLEKESGVLAEGGRESLVTDEILKLHKKNKSSEGRNEGEGSDSSGRSHGHKRQRSRDLNILDSINSDSQEVIARHKKEEGKVEDRVKKSEDWGSSHAHNEGMPLVNRPVIDGRHRHSSGSRPSSPVVSIASSEERPRMSIADQLREQNSKLSKLKENSRAGDQISKSETSRRSSSNESISSTAGDVSKRSPSADSLHDSSREETEPNTEGKHMGLATQGRKSQSTHRDVTQSKMSRDAFLLPNMEGVRRDLLGHKKSNTEDKDSDPSSKPPSDDERRSSRSRNLSESDAESQSQLPPRAPSESSSGSHSDDSRHTRHSKHQRSPSDHWQPQTEPNHLTHSPIIMEGGVIKKSGTNVRRNQSFHGLLPSKHQDTKSSASNEETSKAEDQTSDTPVRSKTHLRSRTPSPGGSRTPILSAAQLKRYSDGGKQLSILLGKQ